MLAVVRCLEAWRHFLTGATEKFKIWTDHKNLKYFMKAQKLNGSFHTYYRENVGERSS